MTPLARTVKAHAAQAIAKGVHSRIPPCCIAWWVTFFVLSGRPSSAKPPRQAFKDGVYPGYRPCPACFQAGRFVRIHVCTSRCLGKPGGPKSRKALSPRCVVDLRVAHLRTFEAIHSGRLRGAEKRRRLAALAKQSREVGEQLGERERRARTRRRRRSRRSLRRRICRGCQFRHGRRTRRTRRTRRHG